jgi:beta-galactosidase
VKTTLALMAALLGATMAAPAQTNEFFPMAAWYGGGKARAPMLERGARAKKEIWRKDVQKIKATGFNTVRAWIDWASGEPVEKQYNFETLDVLLELAEEEGLKLFVQVYMDSAPQWIGEKHPDSKFVSAGGEVIEPESSPGYCRDHAGVHQLDTAFYEALARRASRSKAFIGWDLWSEPHVINWANPTYISRPEFCFCKHTKARFRTWLKKKYGTLDALNEAWYRRYTSWEQVEPNRLSTILSYTDYIDWKTFIVDKLGEDLRDRYEAVKRGAPNTIITSHAAGVGLFASPHYWEGQSDDWTMALQVDYYGTSFYPKHSAFVDRDVPWRAALMDFTRSFGFADGRKGFYVGELQGGFGTIALNVSPTVTPADLRIWTWTALSRGAKGINYYAWYPMSSGYESGGFGLNELDATVTERAREAGAIARVVDRNQKLFLDARPPKAEVAVIYNPLSHFVGGRQRAAVYGGPQGEVAGIERDSWIGIHRALFPMNVALDYVHIDHMTVESLRQYKLVYFAYPLMMPEAAAKVLRAYVEGGGALVAEARMGWNNERGMAADRIPGMGLWEVMGCRETEISTGDKGRTELRWTSAAFPGMKPGDTIPARWYEEALAPMSPNAKVVAEFAGGRAAAVESRLGKGKTLTLGSYVSAAYFTAPSDAAARFFGGLLEWAGVALQVETSAKDLEVRYLESGNDRLVFVFNHSKQAVETQVSIRLGAGTWSAVDLVTDKPVALEHSGSDVRFQTKLGPDGVMALKVSPK